MVSDANVVSLGPEFAFVSWDGSSGRRVCPLATFGSREPQVLNVRLVCAEPPRADQPELKNAAELHGAIALVVRGGCSFAHKARLLQRAGAVAMLLANNTRDEPLATFTMGESLEELKVNESQETEALTIPCVMMCLHDVRELFHKFPPSVKTGELIFEILQKDEGAGIADQCLKAQRELYDAAESSKGWKAIKRTTSSIIKLLEPQSASGLAAKNDGNEGVRAKDHPAAIGTTQEDQLSLLGFVQWATSAWTYEICFAPLADFCSVRAGASYTGKLVACDPLLANESLRNEEQLRGAVALLRRGLCSFPEKLERVQRAGAVAAIVCNDDEEDLDAAFVMSVDRIDAAKATLPAVMISHNVFLRMQAALNGTTARVLCRAGGAADGLLAMSGQAISFQMLSRPSSRLDPGQDSEDGHVLRTLLDLHVACHDGDHAACQQILSTIRSEEAKRELVNAPCSSTGSTALHYACVSGNDNVVEWLLQLGASPMALDLAMQTSLHVACANGHPKCAQLLLRAEGARAQVPAVLYNADEAYGGLATRRHLGGATAMHGAARAGCAECIELLLACNARMECITEQDTPTDKYVFLGVNATDLDGKTPLHMACELAHAECAMYLIAANANVNAKDFAGRSPLYLSCAAVNEPTKETDAFRIADKLICSGAVVDMQVEQAKGVLTSERERLLLDLVESSSLRRELEVLYLRNEARKARAASDQWQKEGGEVSERLENVECEVSGLQRQVQEHEAYRYQLEQLQLQLQMLLRVQSCNGTSSRPLELNDMMLVATTRPPSNPQETTDKKEEELALDAALARDLGKRCCREKQFHLAVQYFQQSLDLLPLPGVRKLLDNARKRSIEDCTMEKSMETFAFPNTSRLKTSTSDTMSSSAKSAKVQHLQRLVDAVQTTPQARALLDQELRKVATVLDSASEFAIACRWMEWLVALPWGDSHFDGQLDDICTSKRRAFEHLDQMEAMQHQEEHLEAVRVIQRAFRKQNGVRLHCRVLAAIRIQATVRGYLARKVYELVRSQALTRLSSRQAEEQVVAPLNLDYRVAVDPAMTTKLNPAYQVKRLVVGYDDSSQEKTKFLVAQLVECSEARAESHSIALMRSKTLDETSSRSCFFVWNRWRRGVHQRVESSLSGPYEDQRDAERRLHQLIQDLSSGRLPHLKPLALFS